MTRLTPEVCRNIGGKWIGGECKPPAGKLLVKREKFIRGKYTRTDGTEVARAEVPTTFMIIKDVGAKGRGPKIIKIEQKGTLTRYGYSIKKPARERHGALNKAVNRYGAKVVYHKLTAMVNLREKAGVPGAHPRRGKEKEWSTFRADRNYVFNKFHPDLTPRKAIKKWSKGMTHAQRVKSRRYKNNVVYHMDKYSIFCSNEHVLNEDINEEVKKGNIPINLSCALGLQNVNCCILMKKHIDTGKDYVPEPKILK